MLSQLYIKNIAVIKEADINFAQGFNVFTGETGAGKTILINAINAVLGERTSRDIIRTGENSASITAVFDDVPPRVLSTLADLGYEIESGDSLLIMRTLHQDGKTQCKINGQPATVSMLKNISGMLINVHGQHDSQQLLSAEKHLGYIDLYGGLGQALSEYQTEFARLREINDRIGALSADEAEKAHKTDLLTYQINEITEAALTSGEEEELLSQRRILRNSERITQALAAALALLSGDENGETPGIVEQMEELAAQLEEAGRYMEDFAPTATAVSGYKYELEDCASSVQDALDNMDYDPARAEYIENRLDTINMLKRKYGADIPAILAFLEKAKAELDDITFSEEKLAQLEQERSRQFAGAMTWHGSFPQTGKRPRKSLQPRFRRSCSSWICRQCGSFRCSGKRRCPPLEWTTLSCRSAPTWVKSPSRWAKIASGGELSRIMLAMKNVLSDRDNVDTMIFDEIDTGVSGRAAQKIGRKLHEVSAGRQVICVTHLAQVAAYADHHLLISKKVRDGKTFTSVESLSEEERTQELARIMGGDVITPATLSAAAELLEKSR